MQRPDENQRAIYKGYVTVLLIISLIGVLVVGLAKLGGGVYCNYLKVERVPLEQIAPVIRYLRQHAGDVDQVAHMCDRWDDGQVFPAVLETVCSDSVDAHHFKLRGNQVVISQDIWEATGEDAMAYKAIVFFAEFQHTPLGGNLLDQQPTQDKLMEVRGRFPRSDRTPRVTAVRHQGTHNDDQ